MAKSQIGWVSGFKNRRAIIGFGRSLRIPLLAEGDETQAQRTILVQGGCDEVQGYLTRRPLAISDYADIAGRKAAVPKFARAV